jgi:hypothetical protein
MPRDRALRWAGFAAALLLAALPACQPQKDLKAQEVPRESAEIEAPPIGENAGIPDIDEPVVQLSDCLITDPELCEDPSGCAPDNVVTDLSPTFTWTYACTPDAYGIVVQREGLEYAQFVDHVDEYDAQINGPKKSWFPGRQLDPGSHYIWTVHSLVSTWSGTDSLSYFMGEFWTGPRCEPATMETPDLTMPFTDAVTDPGNQVTLSWKWLQDGCTPDSYEPQLSTHADFSSLMPLTYETDIPAGLAVSEDELEPCTYYRWRVRAISQGTNGPWSGTRTFTTRAADGGKCLWIPHFLVAKKAVCRLGYSTEYPILHYFDAGQELEITGRNRQMTWLQLGDCWIAANLGEVEGELEPVRILSAPPLPTPTEEPIKCTVDLDKGDCKDAGGEWVDLRKPFCRCP